MEIPNFPGVVSTSYCGSDFFSLFVAAVSFYNPKTIVEIGCQQGGSAVALGAVMRSDAKLWLYDKFDSEYDLYPHGSTQSSLSATEENIRRAGLDGRVYVTKLDAYDVWRQHPTGVDIVHIDIGNTLETVSRILPHWLSLARQAILLEGGVHNRWQRENSYSLYTSHLDSALSSTDWRYVVFCRGSHYALTLLTRRPFCQCPDCCVESLSEGEKNG